VLDDVQTPFAVAFASAVVDPAHTSVVPLIAATNGIAFTVSAVLTVVTHPFALVTVYKIVVLPEATPVTTPVALTVAVAVLAVDHTPPVVAFASAVVAPSHTDVVPVIAATTGALLIVTVVVTALVHPFEFVYV
jgi:hypothetical protein